MLLGLRNGCIYGVGAGDIFVFHSFWFFCLAALSPLNDMILVAQMLYWYGQHTGSVGIFVYLSIVWGAERNVNGRSFLFRPDFLYSYQASMGSIVLFGS